MPRAIWSGSVSFGLVNMPVKLYGAAAEQDVRFHQLDEKTGARIRHRKVSEKTGREVPNERIVKGYELRRGKYVTLTDEEVDVVAPEQTRTIDIEDFVPLASIDPVHFQRSYWLTPDASSGAARAYALLRDAMADADRAAIGRFVLRTKPHLVAIRVADGALILHTMLFADEVVDAGSLSELPVKAKAGRRELSAAHQLIDSLSVDWDPDRYDDTYRERLLDAIKRKEKGEEVVTVPAEAERAEVVDLMAALEESLEQRPRRADGRRRRARSGTKSQRRTRATRQRSQRKRSA